MEENQNPPTYVEIPWMSLSAEALQGVIEEFILRYGTDYGVHEVSHEAKVQQVQKQINRGDIKIVFDPQLESVTLMTAAEWKKTLTP